MADEKFGRYSPITSEPVPTDDQITKAKKLREEERKRREDRQPTQ